MSSNTDQIKTIFRISQILGAAFQQVNSLCANFLAEQSVEIKSNQINHKAIKTTTQTKPQPKQIKLKQEVVQNIKPILQQKSIHKTQQSQKQQPIKKQNHPDKPKQPLSAFFIFQSDQKENVKKLHPDVSITDLSRRMGQIWQGLDQDEKQPYVKKQQQLKAIYNKQMTKFYQKHPEEKSKNQIKKQKAASRNNNLIQAASSPAQKTLVTQKTNPNVKKNTNNQKAPVKRAVVIEEEQDSS